MSNAVKQTGASPRLPVEHRYLTYTEAETYTGLSRVTLWRAVRDGKLKAGGYGSAVRFDVQALDALMSSRASSR